MDQSDSDPIHPQLDDDAFLITWLRDRDAACPLCGYNLRGLTSPRCPECGEAVELSVSLVEPYHKAWIATLVAILLPAGVGMLLAIGLIRFGWPRHLSLGQTTMFLYSLGSIPASLLVVTQRRRFLQFARPLQHAFAAIAWLALLLAFGGILSGMK